ncbi:NUDIX hydrolase [Lentibacillus salicampi]|uniref:NUDIX domain-containing protein n=1 Tax=Lentibacillus salicampi TaxID=175306 RepID=A0A4Y9A7Z8_9BACI|nr:NUDIX domain-containing protein [Lentibacillus salicampi]TFJ91873.1 NUDIX domain-containing protein [Lentibacillus salicampi]
MELWDVYDGNRHKTGRMHERGTPLPDGDYHLVVNVWIINDKGDFLLSKRHPNKDHPNLWECTGGSVVADETSLEGAMREVSEEVGIDLSDCRGKLMKSERRHDYFRDVWVFHKNFDIAETTHQPNEVSDAKWVTTQELENMFEKGHIVPGLNYFKEFITFQPDKN